MFESMGATAIAQIGGLHGPEILILVFVAIILLFGSKKLPELARGLGRASGEFRRGKEEITRELNELTKEQPQPAKSASTVSQPSANVSSPMTNALRPKYNTQPRTEEEKKEMLIKAAKDLGIETENKSEEEIRKEISLKVTGTDAPIQKSDETKEKEPEEKK